MKKLITGFIFYCFLSPVLPFAQSLPDLSDQQKTYLTKAYRFEKNGWIYLQIKGSPKERGFQHGYLLANEISQGITDTEVNWKHLSGMEWSWLINKADAMFAGKIDPENLEEMKGIVEGMNAAGKESSLAEMITYNAWIELYGYWYPMELKKMDIKKVPAAPESCSAFIATGSMTSGGGIVMGHNTMADYHEVFCNVVISIVPEKGYNILMQTVPGWIHSGTDFFVTEAGLVGCETTIGDFEGFDTGGIPEFSRMRCATQYAGNIDEWCITMKHGNNGGYANAWLLGDVNTGEIARLEQGLKFTAFEKTKDGYYSGSNIAENIQILRFETTTDENDIRDMAIARRVRWKQLMSENAGKINVEKAKQFEADHFDTYRRQDIPGGRGLCCHAELETDDCSWPTSPYYPAGTMDAKVIDSKMAKKMSFTARWGSACGMPFEADKFLEKHPQFEWMQGILHDRPSQPWVVFTAGDKR
jgi:hypothetical protein